MGPFGNAILGILFFVIGAAATVLMYKLWGYPFDHTTYKSEAPPKLMLLHRLLGWVFLGIYGYLMVQMVPRLWSYQIELPARTVAHLMLGMTIGAILVIKIVIVRFFKHLEGPLVPALGTSMLVGTVVMIGLSAPIAVREAAASQANLAQPAKLERVRTQLKTTGLEDAQRLEQLSSEAGLRAGRTVLSTRCVGCHDLRMVLARPRTAEDWRETVRRMSVRSALIAPISEAEEWEVTAYLVAISPDLQSSAKVKKEREEEQQRSEEAVAKAGAGAQDAAGGLELARARDLFQKKCSQCHPAELVETAKLGSAGAVSRLIERMVKNGMTASPAELEQIARFLAEKYGR